MITSNRKRNQCLTCESCSNQHCTAFLISQGCKFGPDRLFSSSRALNPGHWKMTETPPRLMESRLLKSPESHVKTGVKPVAMTTATLQSFWNETPSISTYAGSSTRVWRELISLEFILKIKYLLPTFTQNKDFSLKQNRLDGN